MSEPPPQDYAGGDSAVQILTDRALLDFSRLRWRWLNGFRIALFIVLVSVMVYVLCHASDLFEAMLAPQRVPPCAVVPPPANLMLALLAALVALLGMCLFLLSRLVEFMDPEQQNRKLAHTPSLELGERAKDFGDAAMKSAIERLRKAFS